MRPHPLHSHAVRLWTKQWMAKWPYIVNALFWILQKHGEWSYFCRFQRGDRPNRTPLDLPLYRNLKDFDKVSLQSLNLMPVNKWIRSVGHFVLFVIIKIVTLQCMLHYYVTISILQVKDVQSWRGKFMRKYIKSQLPAAFRDVSSSSQISICLHKWGMALSADCECGAEEQTVDHVDVVLHCPIHRPPYMECMAGQFWMTRQSNGCSTPDPRSSAA